VNESGRPNDGPNTEFMLTNYFAGHYSDYNIWVGSAPTFGPIYATPGVGDTWVPGILTGLPAWQTWLNNNRGMTVPIWNTAHADPSSITTPLSFDQYGLPSAPANIGTNLTALGVTELNSDFWGNARPAVGTWMAGAVQDDPAVVVQGAPITGRGHLKVRGRGRLMPR
jgi:hypothetical protein